MPILANLGASHRRHALLLRYQPAVALGTVRSRYVPANAAGDTASGIARRNSFMEPIPTAQSPDTATTATPHAVLCNASCRVGRCGGTFAHETLMLAMIERVAEGSADARRRVAKRRHVVVCHYSPLLSAGTSGHPLDDAPVCGSGWARAVMRAQNPTSDASGRRGSLFRSWLGGERGCPQVVGSPCLWRSWHIVVAPAMRLPRHWRYHHHMRVPVPFRVRTATAAATDALSSDSLSARSTLIALLPARGPQCLVPLGPEGGLPFADRLPAPSTSGSGGTRPR
jgi:hypothetical protein